MQTEEIEKMSQACRASVERFAKKYSDKIMREVYRELEKMDVPFYEGVREE